MATWLDSLQDKISSTDLDTLRIEAMEGRDPIDFIMERKLLPYQSLLLVMSEHYRIPSLRLASYHPDEKAVSRINEEVARRFHVLPLFELDGHLYVAMTDPEDLQAQDYLKQLTGMFIEPVIVTRKGISEAINRVFLTKEQTARAMETFDEKKDEAGDELIVRLEDEEAPVIKLVNYIITQAVNLTASDIHIEAFPERVLLRYRIDGILHEFPPPPFHLYRALVSRIKIISNLDVAERRMPQDGRSTFQVGGKRFDLRVSVIPNVYGEGVVIRILDTEGKDVDIEGLGFGDTMLERYKKIVRRPHGILLVTGPTGSGKTTTLYATLKEIYTPKRKIITLEDPVEYKLDGITQIQVNPEIEFTFAHGLRSILRHDPDVIMLGEVRDLESAEIAIRSSLTGHLVFSTLHTNDSISAVTRLVDMGVPLFLVFASLIGVVAQRLVRRLCPKCKVEVKPDAAMLSSLELKELPPGATVYEPKGCQSCSNIGYRGRVAVYELFELNAAMRQLGADQASPGTLLKYAEERGFVSLRESALRKMYEGITSVEEVLSFTIEE